MTPEETLDRAGKAEKLLQDPAFRFAFDTIRTTLLGVIEDAPISDHESVHESRLMLKLLKSLEGHISHAVRDGKIIVHRLEEKKRLSPADYSAAYRGRS